MSRPEVAMSGLPLPEPVADEDDDGLQDRAALLTPARPRPGRRRPRPRPHAAAGRCLPLVKTLTICLAFFSLGLCVALPGPTLLDLQDQVSVSLAQISQIFLWRALGYLAGSMLSGLLFDKLNRLLMMLVSIALAAAGMATVPWLTSPLSLNVCFATLGVPLGFVDTGGNVLLLDLWGKSSGPYMQAIHFSFGLGAFAAPLLAVPFISHTALSNGTTAVLLGRNHLHTVRLPGGAPDGPGPDIDVVTRPPTELLTRLTPERPPPGPTPLPQFARLGVALAGGDAAVRIARQAPQPPAAVGGLKSAGGGGEARHRGDPAGRHGGGTGGDAPVGGAGTVPSGGDAAESAMGGGSGTGTMTSVHAAWDGGGNAADATVAPPDVTAGNVSVATVPTDDAAVVALKPAASKPAEHPSTARKVLTNEIRAREDKVTLPSGVFDGTEKPQVAGQNATEQAMYDAASSNVSITEPPRDGTTVAGSTNASEPADLPVAQHTPKPKPVFTDGNKLEHDQTWARPPLKPALHPAPAPAPAPRPDTAEAPPTAEQDSGTQTAGAGSESGSEAAGVTGASTEAAETAHSSTPSNSVKSSQSSQAVRVSAGEAVDVTTSPAATEGASGSVAETGPGEIPGPASDSAGEPAGVGSASHRTAASHSDASQAVTVADKPNITSESGQISSHTAKSGPSTLPGPGVRPSGAGHPAHTGLLSAGVGPASTGLPVTEGAFGSDPSPLPSTGRSSAGGGASGSTGWSAGPAATLQPVQTPVDARPAMEPGTGHGLTAYGEGEGDNGDGDGDSAPVAGTEPGLSVPAPPPTAAVPATPPGAAGAARAPSTDQRPVHSAEPTDVYGSSDGDRSAAVPLPGTAGGPQSSPASTSRPPQPSEVPASGAVTDGAAAGTSPSSPASPRPHKPGTYDDTSAEDGLLTRLSSAAAVRGITPLAQLYLLVSCSLLVVALIFLALLVYDPRARRAAPAADAGAGPSRCYTAALVTLMAIVLCFYVGMEVAMGQLLMSFSVHAQVHLTRAGGAYVTSVFWGLFAAGRALSICVAGVLRPAAVLAIDYALVTAGAAILLAAGSWDRTALLLGGAVSGLGMASVFPAALVWLEQHIHVGSRLAAVLVVAGATGEMLLPAGVGALMAYEPRALTYSLAGCTGVCLLMQAAAVLTARLGRPAVGPLQGYQLAAQEDDDDMVDMSKYPGSGEEGGRRLLRM